MQDILIETKRLIIRNPKAEDLPDWHRLMSDAQNMRYLQDIMTRSEQETREVLESAIYDIANLDRRKYFLTVEERDGGYVGQIGYTVTEATPVGLHVHLGYFILPEHHGRGYTTEACRALLEFAFEQGNVYRIETGALVENAASIAVMKKCGLVCEGVLKDYAWHDGEHKDRAIYRMLRSEWTRINP
jgi:ribosomal-protein-alanine N-acetyltransferase